MPELSLECAGFSRALRVATYLMLTIFLFIGRHATELQQRQTFYNWLVSSAGNVRASFFHAPPSPAQAVHAACTASYVFLRTLSSCLRLLAAGDACALLRLTSVMHGGVSGMLKFPADWAESC